MADETRDDKKRLDLFERRSVRWTVFGVIPAMVFALVSAAIRVSQYGIDHTILVYGDRVLVSGRSAALRVSLMSDDGRFFIPEELSGFIQRKKERHLLFGGAVSDRGQALGCDFSVPGVQKGRYELSLDIRFDKKRRIVRTPVDVADRPRKEALFVPKDVHLDADLADVELESLVVQALPEDRGAPAGIESALFIRTLSSDGSPAAVDVEMGVPGREGTVKERTDELGIMAMSVHPRELAFPIRIVGSRRPGEPARPPEETSAAGSDAGPSPANDAYLRPTVVYSGVAASVMNPISRMGEPVRLTIEQISFGGPLFVDLFHDGSFVRASSGWLSGQRASIDVAPERPGLYRIQLSTTPFSADKDVAVRHFYVLGDGESPVDGLRAILERLRTSKKDGAWARSVLKMPLEQSLRFKPDLAAAFALSRLYKGHRAPENLVSSRKEDDRELGELKAGFQRMVMLAIIALGTAVSLLIAIYAYSSVRRQQRLTRMILEEADLDDDNALRPDAKRSGAALIVLQGLVILFIVLGAFVSIALLVDTLTWRA